MCMYLAHLHSALIIFYASWSISIRAKQKCLSLFHRFENTIKKKKLTESVNAAYFPFCSDFVCFGLRKEEDIIGDLMLASLHLNYSS